MTAWAQFTQTWSRSIELSMKPSSIKNAIGFVFLMNQIDQKRVCVSGFAHRFLILRVVASAWLMLAAFLRAYVDCPCANTSQPVQPHEFMWSSIHISPSIARLLIYEILSLRFSHSGTTWITCSWVVQNHILKIWFATLRTQRYSVLSRFFGSTAHTSLYIQRAHFQFSVLIQFLAELCQHDINIAFILWNSWK